MDSSTVLIVDDSIEELRILVSMLKSAGYRLVISRNGRDAINRTQLLRPDLIVLDVRMPAMDGFAVLRLLKNDDTTADIPVIFLTAANDLDDRLEGLGLGAVDYLVKPTSEEEVLLRIGIHLNLSNAARSRAQVRPDAEASQDSSGGFDDMLIKTACGLLEENLALEISIDELAEKVGTHRHKLTQLFKDRFGCTVFAWWRERKMLKAKSLLLESDLSIQSISDELGYNSSSNFTTAFKERFGVPPRVFRDSLKVSALK